MRITARPLLLGILILFASFGTQATTSSSVTLASSPNPSIYGRSVTLTATVTSGATGAVTFYDGATVLGTATVTGGVASLSTPSLGPGSRRLTAYYRGDSSFAASVSGVLAHTVQSVAGNVFAVAPYTSVPPNQSGLAVADFNHDGKADFVWAGIAGAGIQLGNGDGTFQAPHLIDGGVGLPFSRNLAIGDFNGDGNLDIVVGRQSPFIVVIVLLGNGDGTFQTGVTLNVATIPHSLAAADFNGDGKLDLVVAEQTQVSVYTGAGNGNFLPPVVCATGTFLMQIAVGDFNGDRNADLVIADSVADGVGGVKVLFGNGNGSFQTPALFNVVFANALLVADLDQDGLDDLAIGTGTAVEILMGTANSGMRYNGLSALPDYVNSLLARGDFNGDGKIDLAAGLQSGQVVLMSGDGAGNFAAGVRIPLSQYLNTIIDGDFNGDGRTDLALIHSSQGLLILYSVSGTMTASGTPQSAPLGTAFASPLAVTIKDAAGIPVRGVTVGFSVLSTGAGAVLSSSNAVTDGAGVASVTATANNTVGAYSVLASAGSLSAGFNLLNVADLPASLATVSGTPQSAAAAMPFRVPLKVILKNSAGQPVSGATISYSAPTGIVLSGPTATTDSSGTAQVWATAGNLPATYSVTASNGSLNATFSLTVSPRVAVSLSASPNPSRYGQPVTLTATVPSGVTGQITFYDGVAILGTSTLAGGNASLSTVLLPSGARTITALYGGDSGNPATRSAPVIQTVSATPNSAFNFASAGATGETYSQSRHPADAVVADFNGDGKADVAVANGVALGSGSVSVMLGNGDGTYRSGIRCALSGEAQVIASGDFNGDGKADLAVGVISGPMFILLGNGDGSMTAAGSYATNPSSIVVTDVDRDGRADLVALDGSTGTLSVFLGNGNGTFQAPVTYAVGAQYQVGSLVVADFNGDGVPDFALTHRGYTNTVSVLIANPDGTLQPARDTTTNTYPWNIAAGDFNGDGKVDLIALGSQDWTVLLGNGDGTFQVLATTSYPTWTISRPVVADVNGDGKADVALVYGNSGSQGVLLLFGNGDGSLQAPVTYAGTSSYTMVAAGDFTGEGKPDVLFLDTINASVMLLRNTVSGVGVSSTHAYGIWQGLLGASYVLTVANNQTTATTGVISVADTLPAAFTATGMAGSGWSCDLASLTCSRSDSLAAGASYPPIVLTFNVASNAPAQVINSVAVSLGGTMVATASDPTSVTGSLYATTTTLTVSPTPANLGQSVTLTAHVGTAMGGLVVFYDGASVLGSSLMTLSQSASFTTNALPAGTRLLHAYFRGNGVDAPSTSPTVSLIVRAAASQGFSPLGGYTVTGNAYSIAGGDFNGDGKTDLAIANGSGVSVLLGSGNATFQPPVDYTANRASRFVASADFNGDGKADIVTANPSTNDVTVFLANSDGTFQAGVNYPVGLAPYSVAIGDLDGDGIPDLAIPNSAGNSLTILLGTGDGTFRTFVTYPVPAGPYSAVIADFNGDSKPDLAVTSSTGAVAILLGSGNGIFQSPATVTLAGAPVAIAAADLNGDGMVDLAVAVAGTNNVSVLRGRGDGTFQTPLVYSAGASPSALAIGDLNGDGKLDLAVGSGSGGGVTTLPGNGDGTFGAATVYATSASITSLTVADFDSDARADLAITTGAGALTTSAAVSRVSSRAVTVGGSNNVLIYQGRAATRTPQPSTIGTYNGGLWQLDGNGNGRFDAGTDRSFALGFPGATYVTGDWNGDGKTKAGVYNNGYWFLDYDGNGVWDGGVKDKLIAWGWAGATPIVGDWNGDGKTKIGVYSNGFWFLDYNGDYLWDGGVVDKQVGWGWAGVMPIVGDWNGDGKTKIGVYVNGFWFLDYDGNYVWDGGVVDKQVGWGWAGVTPIVGDWNGDGKTKIGVYAGGYWYIDYDGNYLWEYPANDKIWSMGWTGTTPVMGDWNGDGKTKPGAFINGYWYLDYNGNGVFDGAGTDRIFAFGASGDTPVVGRW